MSNTWSNTSSNTLSNTWPRLGGPVQVLQVFNRGQACGWLGKVQGDTQQGFWFHYSSASTQQPWLGLNMPPSQNHYQQATLFEVFQQHLPTQAGVEYLQEAYPQTVLGELELLSISGANTLGSLSFANPDAPLVQPKIILNETQLRELTENPEHLLGLPLLRGGLHPSNICYLVSQSTRYNTPDLLLFPSQQWHGTAEELRSVQKQTDPNGLLRGLDWVKTVQGGEYWVYCQRPDLDHFRQQRLGLDSFASILNLKAHTYQELIQNAKRFKLVAHEIIRTYCRNTALEIKRFDALLDMIQSGELNAHIVYEQPKLNSTGSKPQVLGVDYCFPA